MTRRTKQAQLSRGFKVFLNVFLKSLCKSRVVNIFLLHGLINFYGYEYNINEEKQKQMIIKTRHVTRAVFSSPPLS